MGSVNIQFIAPGTIYEGKAVENPILKYKGRALIDRLVVDFDRSGTKVQAAAGPVLGARIIVDPSLLSFTALRYMWEGDRPVVDSARRQKCYVSSHGFFDQGGGKYTVRTKGPLIFVPWQKLVEQGRAKAQAARIAKKRVEALKQFEDAIKKGRWEPTRLFDFGISFPDFSYWTWQKDEEEARIAKAPVGPKDSLAEMWGGWTPDSILTPDVAPPRYKESIDRGIQMMQKVPSIQHLALLPEKEDRSPIIFLKDDGVMVNRVVDIPTNVE